MLWSQSTIRPMTATWPSRLRRWSTSSPPSMLRHATSSCWPIFPLSTATLSSCRARWSGQHPAQTMLDALRTHQGAIQDAQRKLGAVIYGGW